jgi:hypothetical protein
MRRRRKRREPAARSLSNSGRAHVRIDVDRKSNQLVFEPMGREAMV